MEFTIPFTQYLMPDGHKSAQEFPTQRQEVKDKADKIIAAGLRFGCEMLSDYITCSFTITGFNPEIGEDTDLAQKLAPNGPGVVAAVESLIMDFDLEVYQRSL